MTDELLHGLWEITPEEPRILDGKNEIEQKLFVHFPAHTHNYVEVIFLFIR